MRNLFILAILAVGAFYGYRYQQENKIKEVFAQTLCGSGIVEAAAQGAKNSRATTSAVPTASEILALAQGAGPGGKEARHALDQYYAAHESVRAELRALGTMNGERRAKVLEGAMVNATHLCRGLVMDLKSVTVGTLAIITSANEN